MRSYITECMVFLFQVHMRLCLSLLKRSLDNKEKVKETFLNQILRLENDLLTLAFIKGLLKIEQLEDMKTKIFSSNAAFVPKLLDQISKSNGETEESQEMLLNLADFGKYNTVQNKTSDG